MYPATNRGSFRFSFTLLELIVAMGIFTIFFGVAYKLFNGARKQASISMWHKYTTTQQRNAFSILKTDLLASSYPSLVFGATMEDSSEAMVADHFCSYRKNVQAPGPGEARPFLAFPVSKPYNGKDNGETIFKVYCLVGEKQRNFNQLASLYFFEFKSEYTTSAWSGISISGATFVRKRQILENVREIDIDALQSIEILLKCEMPDVATSKRQNVGSVRLDGLAGKCAGNL